MTSIPTSSPSRNWRAPTSALGSGEARRLRLLPLGGEDAAPPGPGETPRSTAPTASSWWALGSVEVHAADVRGRCRRGTAHHQRSMSTGSISVDGPAARSSRRRRGPERRGPLRRSEPPLSSASEAVPSAHAGPAGHRHPHHREALGPGLRDRDLNVNLPLLGARRRPCSPTASSARRGLGQLPGPARAPGRAMHSLPSGVDAPAHPLRLFCCVALSGVRPAGAARPRLAPPPVAGGLHVTISPQCSVTVRH